MIISPNLNHANTSFTPDIKINNIKQNKYYSIISKAPIKSIESFSVPGNFAFGLCLEQSNNVIPIEYIGYDMSSKPLIDNSNISRNVFPSALLVRTGSQMNAPFVVATQSVAKQSVSESSQRGKGVPEFTPQIATTGTTMAKMKVYRTISSYQLPVKEPAPVASKEVIVPTAAATVVPAPSEPTRTIAKKIDTKSIYMIATLMIFVIIGIITPELTNHPNLFILYIFIIISLLVGISMNIVNK